MGNKKKYLSTKNKKMDHLKSAKIVDKSGAVTVGSTTVVCVYFSAHWCPPCRGFTPVLGKFYEEVNKDGKRMEIIFVSCDQDEKQFEEYHNSMPFIAAPWSSDRQNMGQAMGVSGIPALMVMKKDGTVASKNGRGDVTGGKSPQEVFEMWKGMQ